MIETPAKSRIRRIRGPRVTSREALGLRQLGISVEATADVLEGLAGLAQRAWASGRRLYCWWAL
ncbi:hypothetical protein [Streptomyces sp. NPDC058583]|uniref:hypothetical protein n=1 Tax=unclassified Streptomyces TaxID=2593676 RepID=UPI00365F9EB5